jgi:hypothetical protein
MEPLKETRKAPTKPGWVKKVEESLTGKILPEEVGSSLIKRLNV